MNLLLLKKQNLTYINKTLLNLKNKLLIKKNENNINLTKDADISFPVFFKGINHFTLNGMKIRKKYKKNNVNQTITIQSKLSKQLIKLTVSTQCPLIKIR